MYRKCFFLCPIVYFVFKVLNSILIQATKQAQEVYLLIFISVKKNLFYLRPLHVHRIKKSKFLYIGEGKLKVLDS